MNKRNNNKKISDDVLVKEFWRNNERFADLFNAVLFDGKQIINASELKEIDTDVSGTIQIKDYKETLKRARDVVKKYYNGVEFNILGLEMQENVHLAMPLRTMIYDALGYIKEYNEIRDKNNKSGYKGNSKEEFLSGLKYSDRFHPIITIVFYYGETPWNAPTRLTDMMVTMPDEINKMFNDYKLNLVQISDSDKYKFNNNDVRALFDIIHGIYNRNFDYISRNYADKSFSSDFIEMIGAMTGTEALINVRYNNRRSGVSNMQMWTAMKEFRDGGIREGEIKGRDQAKLDIIKTLMKKLNKTSEEVMDMLDITEKDKKRYLEMLDK